MKRVRRSKSKGGGAVFGVRGRFVLGFSFKSSISREKVVGERKGARVLGVDVGRDLERLLKAVRDWATVSAMPPRTALVIIVVRTGFAA